MNVVDEYSQKFVKAAEKLPKFNVGDTVRVHFRIVEGEKERIQVFEGVVIARKGAESPAATFTVRRSGGGTSGDVADAVDLTVPAGQRVVIALGTAGFQPAKV